MISDPLAFLLWFFLLQSPFLAPPVSSPARPPERPDTLAPTSSPTSHPTSSNKPVLSPLPTSLPVLPKNPTPQGWRNFRLYEPSRWWNFRFHAEIGPSAIDGKHALLLAYSTPRPPEPLALQRDGRGAPLGGSASVLFWIGLEAS